MSTAVPQSPTAQQQQAGIVVVEVRNSSNSRVARPPPAGMPPPPPLGVSLPHPSLNPASMLCNSNSASVSSLTLKMVKTVPVPEGATLPDCIDTAQTIVSDLHKEVREKEDKEKVERAERKKKQQSTTKGEKKKKKKEKDAENDDGTASDTSTAASDATMDLFDDDDDDDSDEDSQPYTVLSVYGRPRPHLPPMLLGEANRADGKFPDAVRLQVGGASAPGRSDDVSSMQTESAAAASADSTLVSTSQVYVMRAVRDPRAEKRRYRQMQVDTSSSSAAANSAGGRGFARGGYDPRGGRAGYRGRGGYGYGGGGLFGGDSDSDYDSEYDEYLAMGGRGRGGRAGRGGGRGGRGDDGRGGRGYGRCMPVPKRAMRGGRGGYGQEYTDSDDDDIPMPTRGRMMMRRLS